MSEVHVRSSRSGAGTDDASNTGVEHRQALGSGSRQEPSVARRKVHLNSLISKQERGSELECICPPQRMSLAEVRNEGQNLIGHGNPEHSLPVTLEAADQQLVLGGCQQVFTPPAGERGVSLGVGKLGQSDYPAGNSALNGY